MIVAAILTVLGLLIGVGIVQQYGLRLSGVLVVPLFAVYALYDFVAIPAFTLGTVAAYVGLIVLQRRTFLFGRQLLLASMGLSTTVPLGVFGGLSLIGVPGLTFSEVTFVGSILPGVAAYNYHQLEADRRREDVLLSVATLIGLTGLGVGLVNLSLAPYLGQLTPPVLYSDGSDIAVLQQAVVSDSSFTLGASLSLVLGAILVGLLVSEGAYFRWGIRLNGLIALPLLALFSLQSAAVLPLYVAGLAVVYWSITQIHRRTLLYGRVLLAIGLAIAVAGFVPVAIVVPVSTGLHLFFTAVLVGIGAYNLHRMPPEHRSTSIALSASAFVGFLGGLRLLIEPTRAGLLVDPGLLEFGVAVAVLAVGAVTAIRLERLRPSAAERRRIASHDHT
ncbi:poly-gamma-glutamate biosynthesis protein PgsC/CapC [Natronolimnohabitans sp. A-GB9]|uniref:poly-gamma-glutamate biosynthesis protein PgsC/CapC n=1 Tax=Natronolimnohabitans sp. A-GB9 TaxID=3069757 RepID=UPI0027ADECA8|nr:poly-gamma-glutamate biosynthesis protein PgsC/CapC [Natronolimnohabitans sp. A-GB9]MDQ2050217.1 poly-gamma-glutamate biosynthesis protein PgsC/CapC [Natronolimnohabitans sp. A-GB9]